MLLKLIHRRRNFVNCAGLSLLVTPPDVWSRTLPYLLLQHWSCKPEVCAYGRSPVAPTFCSPSKMNAILRNPRINQFKRELNRNQKRVLIGFS